MLGDLLVHALRPFDFRGKVRLLDPLVARSGERMAQIHGSRMRLDLSDRIQRLVYLGTFEREESRFVRRTLRPGGTLVDVGANIGYFSFLAANTVGPTGRVLAIEPSPVAFARLNEVISINELGCVSAVQAGLADKPGNLDLFLPDASQRNHSPSMVDVSAGTATKVRVTTLDRCLSEAQMNSVDLLKIDVEGFEPQVLKGGSESFQNGRVKMLMCEFNDYWLRRAGSSPEQLYRSILDLGFADLHGAPQFPSLCIVTRFFTWRGPS